MDHTVTTFWDQLLGRVTGPMKFRLVMQPAMAMFFAIRDGLRDAREGRPAYFWALFTDRGERESMMKSGWKSVGKVFILATVLDVVYQLIELRWVHPIQALVVAIVLAFVPYMVVRGPVNRIARRAGKTAERKD
jgi:hypothetical protein